MKTYKLHLIRHGLTQGNIDGIYMGGGLDMPLSEAGADGLRALAARFRYPVVGTVFASPMKRALQSAEILFPGAPEKIIMEELRECRFGEFEGMRVAELMEDERFTRWLDPKSGFAPAGGESGAEFGARCVAALRGMLARMATAGIFEAVCVTHGGVIMSMLGQMAMPQKPPAQWMADNGAGYTVQASAAMLMRDDMVEAVAVVPEGYLD
ncbi:histidine phosphatase family protein [Ruminococcaceae bacterium OttesenSCG-928-D13]|nr:histidine phosphatase family protein [Ruminococcaceae bacterium OttesenSCG-928-D13]